MGRIAVACALTVLVRPAFAGPPYLSDDSEPTDYKHYEIYTFNAGTSAGAGTDGETGVDFNYGAAPDLQLTATLPLGFSSEIGGPSQFGLSNLMIRFTSSGTSALALKTGMSRIDLAGMGPSYSRSDVSLTRLQFAGMPLQHSRKCIAPMPRNFASPLLIRRPGECRTRRGYM
jgi:hypothetical protein